MEETIPNEGLPRIAALRTRGHYGGTRQSIFLVQLRAQRKRRLFATTTIEKLKALRLKV